MKIFLFILFASFFRETDIFMQTFVLAFLCKRELYIAIGDVFWFCSV
jgi:hypothetical protein